MNFLSFLQVKISFSAKGISDRSEHFVFAKKKKKRIFQIPKMPTYLVKRHPETSSLGTPSVFAAVADGSMVQTQTLYTEATPEQLEQLQQQGIQYDVITFTDE